MSQPGVSQTREKATPFGGGREAVGEAFGSGSNASSGGGRFVSGGRASLGDESATLPNTRVQRTRSSPSALRSPLTRHPLGGPE